MNDLFKIFKTEKMFDFGDCTELKEACFDDGLVLFVQYHAQVTS